MFIRTTPPFSIRRHLTAAATPAAKAAFFVAMRRYLGSPTPAAKAAFFVAMRRYLGDLKPLLSLRCGALRAALAAEVEEPERSKRF